MTHYGRIMKEIGPLKHLSSMRFESFHQPFKKCATSCNFRVHLIKTLFTKYQLNVANLLLNYEELNANSIVMDKTKNCNDEGVPQMFGLHIAISLTSQIVFNNILYKNGMVVQVSCYEYELPEFAVILNICKQPQQILCLQDIQNHGFDSHFYAFLLLHSVILLIYVKIMKIILS